MKQVAMNFGRQIRIAPALSLLLTAIAVLAGLLAWNFWVEYQDSRWSPFSWHEIEATQDDEVLYFTLSGYKTTSRALEAQVNAFIIGGETNTVACYRPDGTVCTPNPVIGPATEFRSPVFRVLKPANLSADTNARFRVCYTYDSRTWCDSIRADEATPHLGGSGDLEIIIPGLSGEPRQIEALP